MFMRTREQFYPKGNKFIFEKFFRYCLCNLTLDEGGTSCNVTWIPNRVNKMLVGNNFNTESSLKLQI